jgi:hypothetical protein
VVDQSAEDIGSLDGHAGIATTDAFDPGERWPLIKGSVWGGGLCIAAGDPCRVVGWRFVVSVTVRL